MATSTVWSDGDIVQQVEPRRSAPPVMQQPIPQTQDEVVWDDSMMDLEDYVEPQHFQQADPTPETTNLEVQPASIGL